MGNIIPGSPAPSPDWEGSKCVLKHSGVFFVSPTQSLRAWVSLGFTTCKRPWTFHKVCNLSDDEKWKPYHIAKIVKSTTFTESTVEGNTKELWKCTLLFQDEWVLTRTFAVTETNELPQRFLLVLCCCCCSGMSWRDQVPPKSLNTYLRSVIKLTRNWDRENTYNRTFQMF